jgi:hypothetical protein
MTPPAEDYEDLKLRVKRLESSVYALWLLTQYPHELLAKETAKLHEIVELTLDDWLDEFRRLSGKRK